MFIMGAFDSIAEELFKRQIRYKNGRYFIETPFGEPERMNWFSSYYWALLQNTLVKELGNDYYAHEYYIGKLTGHIFGSKISSLVKTKSLVAPMISLIVKQFGYGPIKPIKTDYKDDWATFEFYDTPVSREISKFFGNQKMPVDYAIGGLLAGSAEQLIRRKFIALETTCLACGDNKCTLEILSKQHFAEKIKKIQNAEQKKVLEKILEMEKKTDFKKEVETLMKNRDKKAVLNEQQYLREQGIR